MITGRLKKLINSVLRASNRPTLDPNISELNLIEACDEEIERLDQQVAAGRKYYHAICMVQDPRGPSMTELILNEHPLVWVEGKKKELRDANVRAAVMIQFFSEIPREVYDLMKQPAKVIVEPTAKEKLIIGGK